MFLAWAALFAEPTLADTSSGPRSLQDLSAYTCEPQLFDFTNCLYTKVDGNATMQEAETVCIRAGGHLASIHSDAQRDGITALGVDGAWIGLHDRHSEAGCATSGFIWTDGSAADYTQWASGEPNDWAVGAANCGNSGNEDCVRVRIDGTWEDANCDAASQFVCQHCGTIPTPTIYTLESGTVPTMWDAETECVRKGGHLASVHSDADVEAIFALGNTYGAAWIGFHDMYVEAGCAGDGNLAEHHDIGFIWTDGTRTDYTNWAAGEPNDWADGSRNCDTSDSHLFEREDCSILCPSDSRWGWCRQPARAWGDVKCNNPWFQNDNGGQVSFVCGFNPAWSDLIPLLGGYSTSDSAYDWVDISASESNGTRINGSDFINPVNQWAADDGWYEAALPFNFPYYGDVETLLYIGSNGYITFGTEHYPSGQTLPIPTAGGQRGGVVVDEFVALFWADLDPSSGGQTSGVYFDVDQAAGGSRFIVSYLQIPYCCGSPTPSNSFQSLLFPNGAIVLQYQELQQGGTELPSIGFEDKYGLAGVQISYGWHGVPADASAVAIFPAGVSSITGVRNATALPPPCYNCPAGLMLQLSSASGSRHPFLCTDQPVCANGTQYTTVVGSSFGVCEDCAPGRYDADNDSRTDCVQCREGQSTNETGSTRCLPCPASQVSGIGANECCTDAQSQPAVSGSDICSIDFYDPMQCQYTRVATAKTFQEAEMACLRAGGHLASIHSDQQRDAIKALGGNGSWVGLHDRHAEAGCSGGGDGGFIWTDGSQSDYMAWASGEPDWGDGAADCDSGGGVEDCTFVDATGEWHDADCEDQQDFICQHCGPIPGPTSYKLLSSRATLVTMWEAEMACVRDGGHLASVHSETDKQIVADLIGQYSAGVWIGFHDTFQSAECVVGDNCAGSDDSKCTSNGNDCCAPGAEAATCSGGFTPVRTGEGCWGQSEGTYKCCAGTSPPPGPPVTAAELLESGFVWTDGSATDFTSWTLGEPNDWKDGGGSCDGSEECSAICPSDFAWDWCTPNNWYDISCTGFDETSFVCGYNDAWMLQEMRAPDPCRQATADAPCYTCPAGMYANSTGCEACPPGTHDSGTGSGQEVCLSCSPGLYDADGDSATACVPCPESWYTNVSGATVCQQCPRNMASDVGQTACCIAVAADLQSQACTADLLSPSQCGFIHVPKNMSHNAAQGFCSWQGGSLARVSREDRNAALGNAFNHGDGAWIGLSEVIPGSGEFEWTDGGTFGFDAWSDAAPAILLNTTSGPGVLYRRWHGIPGRDMQQMLTHANYLDGNGVPSAEQALSEAFESPSDVCDNCGTEMQALFRPRLSGPHTFTIAADDNGHLWLGSAGSTTLDDDTPIALVPGWTGVRQWHKYAEQVSSPQQLTAGETYIIKAASNEGNGGDNLAVAVEEPDTTFLAPLPVQDGGHTFLLAAMPRCAAINSNGDWDPAFCHEEREFVCQHCGPAPMATCAGRQPSPLEGQLIMFGCVTHEVTDCGYSANSNPDDFVGALAAFEACKVSGSWGCNLRTDTAEGLRAQDACNDGRNSNIGFHTRIKFQVLCPDTYHFRFHADYGRGGYIGINEGVAVHRSGDIWGYESLMDITLTAGDHIFEALGFEGCCDGHSQLDIQLPGDTSWIRVKSGDSPSMVGSCKAPPSPPPPVGVAYAGACDLRTPCYDFDCPPGYRLEPAVGNNHRCVLCGAGQYASSGASHCEDCTTGTYDHDEDPATECIMCPENMVSAVADTTCHLCANRTYSNAEQGNLECTICQSEIYDLEQCIYTKIPAPKTMEDAEQYCVRAGGHLASVHNEDQRTKIAELGADNTWIGLNDRLQESWLSADTDGASNGTHNFVWTDASSNDFSAWASGQPNDWGIDSDRYLTLCEVQVRFSSGDKNVAEHKLATQSSVGWGGAPRRAVDGSRSGNYDRGSCSHTNGPNSWWQVDLGDIGQISTIDISHRTGRTTNNCANSRAGCATSAIKERAVGARVYVSDTPDFTDTANRQLCGIVKGGNNGRQSGCRSSASRCSEVVDCTASLERGQRLGFNRYVTVTMESGKEDCVHINENGEWEDGNCEDLRDFVCESCGGTVPRPTSYKLINADRSFKDAEMACVADGGHLASVHTNKDHSLIRSIVANAAGIDKVWIGYHDRFAETGCLDGRHQGIGGNIKAQSFIWTDGTITDFDRWADGEPNDWSTGRANCDGTGDEDCATAWRGGRSWNDDACEELYPFVCGYNDLWQNVFVRKSSCTGPEQCMFLPGNAPASMQGAEDACSRGGGHLASLHSDAELDLFNERFTRYDNYFADSCNDSKLVPRSDADFRSASVSCASGVIPHVANITTDSNPRGHACRPANESGCYTVGQVASPPAPLSDTGVPNNATMLGGAGQLVQGTQLMDDLNVTLNYEIGLDITPGSAINIDWASIIHFTATGTDCCAYGSRVPGVWFWPGTRKLYVVDGNRANGNLDSNLWTCSDDLMTMQENVVTNLKLVMTETSANVYVDGVIACNVRRGDRDAHTGVTVFAGDPWYDAADAVVNNFYYLSSSKLIDQHRDMYVYGDVDFVFTALPKFLWGIDFIRTAQHDAQEWGGRDSNRNDFLCFDLDANATVYILFDAGIIRKPWWLLKLFGERHVESAMASLDDGAAPKAFDIYYAEFEQQQVCLGGNAYSSQNPQTNVQNYVVAVGPTGVQLLDQCGKGEIGCHTSSVWVGLHDRDSQAGCNDGVAITICELEVMAFDGASVTNVAQGKSASQSSIDWGGVPSRAVDGSANADWAGGSCTMTQSTGTEWWQVDLGGEFDIGDVNIFHRSDGDQETRSQLLAASVIVSSSPDFHTGTSCGALDNLLGQPDVTKCDRTGRYVTVSLAHGFIWTDASPTDYQAWAAGEPSDWGCSNTLDGGSGDEDCAAVRKSDGLWDDLHCDSTHEFVCLACEHDRVEPVQDATYAFYSESQLTACTSRLSCDELGALYGGAWRTTTNNARRGSDQVCGESDNGFHEEGDGNLCFGGEVAGGADTPHDGWHHAAVICTAIGSRLCTVAELQAEETRGSGCLHDNEWVWAADTCDAGHMTAVGGNHNGQNRCVDTGECTAGQNPCTCTARCETNTRQAAVRCCADVVTTIAPQCTTAGIFNYHVLPIDNKAVCDANSTFVVPPCHQCPSGGLLNGTYEQGDLQCVMCEPGAYTAGGSSPECVSCAAGQHDHDRDPGSACKFCPAGRFSNKVGTTECDGICPNATFASKGSTAAADCQSCSACQWDDDNDPGTPCIDTYSPPACRYTRVGVKKSMQEAEMACLRAGGHLASIHSDQQLDDIRGLGGNGSWIGLHDRHVEAGCSGGGDGGFVWLDGSPTDFVAWASGEPNDWSNGAAHCDLDEDEGSEDCVQMDATGEWFDVDCEQEQEFICQHCGPIPGPTSYKLLRQDSASEFEWAAYARLPMWEAEIACVRDGGHLASIHSSADQTAIEAVLPAGMFNPNNWRSGPWIGFHDRLNEAGCDGRDHTEQWSQWNSQGRDFVHDEAHDGLGFNFVWTDGSRSNFQLWAAGEPNDWATCDGESCQWGGRANCDGLGTEDCTHIGISGSWNWNDAGCDDAREVICGYNDAWSTDQAASKAPCIRCPAGTFENATECRPCAVGTFAAPGSVKGVDCVACIPGTYDHDLDPGTPCLECLPGRFANASGVSNCDSVCASGFTTQPGSTFDTHCTECQPGHFTEDRGSPCLKCPPGSVWFASSGPDSPMGCIPCALDTFSSDAGSLECIACPGGLVSQPGSASISDCKTYAYVGCYRDNVMADRRDLSEVMVQMGSNASLGSCERVCQGYTYMGLQWNDICSCGNSLGTYGEIRHIDWSSQNNLLDIV